LTVDPDNRARHDKPGGLGQIRCRNDFHFHANADALVKALA
jgi:hypothetical protein